MVKLISFGAAAAQLLTLALANSTSPFHAVEWVPPTINRAAIQKLVTKLFFPTNLS